MPIIRPTTSVQILDATTRFSTPIITMAARYRSHSTRELVVWPGSEALGWDLVGGSQVLPGDETCRVWCTRPPGRSAMWFDPGPGSGLRSWRVGLAGANNQEVFVVLLPLFKNNYKLNRRTPFKSNVLLTGPM